MLKLISYEDAYDHAHDNRSIFPYSHTDSEKTWTIKVAPFVKWTGGLTVQNLARVELLARTIPMHDMLIMPRGTGSTRQFTLLKKLRPDLEHVTWKRDALSTTREPNIRPIERLPTPRASIHTNRSPNEQTSSLVLGNEVLEHTVWFSLLQQAKNYIKTISKRYSVARSHNMLVMTLF